jgi:hypothetical protein
MQGHRRPDNYDWRQSEPGDYGFQDWTGQRELYIRDPFGVVGRITSHTVTEHEDGTVTVDPSIAPPDGAEPGAFHGWLRRGVWTW